MAEPARRPPGLSTGMIFLSLLAIAAQPLSATWSVIAVDQSTGEVVVASATCVSQVRLEGFPSLGLMDVQAIVVPGIGVAAAQAGVDVTRANQRYIYDQLRLGTAPGEILDSLATDPNFQRRQFGIVDLRGRCAGFSGSENGAASLSVQGDVSGTGIAFSIQGNILASDDVVHLAVGAFKNTEGTLMDRVMAAMDAADAAGGDGRCTCTSEPILEAACETKTAHVAYILSAQPDDLSGDSFNNGEYSVYINVTDKNIQAHEDANPVKTLRMRYDAWKAEQSG